MSIGKKDRQIQIWRKATTRDASNGSVEESWSYLRTVWAEKQDTGGSKRFLAASLRPETETVFTIWYTENLTELDRIVYREKNYSILSIAEVGRQKELVIQTRTEAVQA